MSLQFSRLVPRAEGGYTAGNYALARCGMRCRNAAVPSVSGRVVMIKQKVKAHFTIHRFSDAVLFSKWVLLILPYVRNCDLSC